MLIEVTIRADSVAELIEQIVRVHMQLVGGAPVSEAAEAPPKKRPGKAAAEKPAQPEEQAAPDPEQFKQQSVDRLSELFFADGTVDLVKKLRRKYAKDKKFADLPADVFPALMAELEEALRAA